MNTAELTQAHQAAISLAREVGTRLREVQRSSQQIAHQFKAHQEIVTELDLWADQLIVERVRQLFPKHFVIGEESYQKTCQDLNSTIEQVCAEKVCWVVDPIDGTRNFYRRIPHFGVSIGILVNGERQLGVVYDPMRDEIFTAIKGQGAKLNGVPIAVSDIAKLEKGTVVGYNAARHLSSKWEEFHSLGHKMVLTETEERHFGSAVLDQCWIAAGRLDASIFYRLSAWDVAAGSLIVEEAGGKAWSLSKPQAKAFSIFDKSFGFATPAIFEACYAT
ncbi:inositol monophosphatase [bacterium]|nr:inositol monophosphatase [bacterium]